MHQSLTLSMHGIYFVLSRGPCSCRCVPETCTPACDWVYAFKFISLSFWVHSTRVVYSHVFIVVLDATP